MSKQTECGFCEGGIARLGGSDLTETCPYCDGTGLEPQDEQKED